jgi:hypothetical protein
MNNAISMLPDDAVSVKKNGCYVKYPVCSFPAIIKNS